MTVPIQDKDAVSTPEHDKDFDEFSHSARNLDIKKEVGLIEEEKKESSVIADSTNNDIITSNDSNDTTNDADTNTAATTADTIIPINNKQEYIEEDETHSKPTHPKYVTPKDFELLKVIGMGAFGKVLQVRVKKTNTIAAMKVISKRLLRRKISYVANIHAERNILSKINSHPFIVTMHCSFQTREKLFIVMDFCSGGELFLRLGREGVFLERTAAFYIGEIVLALEHLHGLGILHRDLKPENILLGKDGHLCITDFGLAKDFNADDSAWGGSKKEGGEGENAEGGGDGEDGRANTICGTQEYMAPEMVARKGYGRAADFWSLGCIAYEMLAGNPPFESRKGSKDLFRKIMNERVRMPDGSSAAACQLLKGLLNRDAQSRLGAAKSTMFKVGGVAGLKQCKFFDGLDWHKLEQKEIDPPVNVTVDNENDLRHFHDEFVQMKLPRSVMEMSQDHFQPRRCESENFRGFSFVQEDFELPERQHSEAEKYWNNVDADGESLSECASSVFDDDYGTNANNDANKNHNNLDTVNESAAAATPAKKKRPPRKKKKKKQQEEEQQKPQDAAAATASPKPAATPTTIEKTENKNEVNAVQQKMEKLDVSPNNGAAPSPAGKTIPAIAAIAEVKMQQQEKKLPQSAPPPKKPAPPPQWESVGKPKKATPTLPTKPAVVGLSSGTPSSGGTGAYRPPHQRQMQQQPQQTNTYKPAPGSWAGRATAAGPPTTRYAKPQQPPPLSMGNYPPQNRGPPPPPNQSDWRQHSPSWSQRGMSHKQPQQPRPNMAAAPSPPLTSAPAPPPKPQLWPALGDDFPPPPGGKGGVSSAGNAPAVKKHQQPPQSSWGAKTSSAKSAWNSNSKSTAGNAWR